MHGQLQFIPDPNRPGTHPARGAYVEACWTSVIGPSGVALLRLVAGMTAHGPVRMHPGELAAVLGISHTQGKNSRLTRTLDRLDRFGLIDRNGTRILVPQHCNPLPTHTVERSCDLVQHWHHTLQPGS